MVTQEVWIREYLIHMKSLHDTSSRRIQLMVSIHDIFNMNYRFILGNMKPIEDL